MDAAGLRQRGAERSRSAERRPSWRQHSGLTSGSDPNLVGPGSGPNLGGGVQDAGYHGLKAALAVIVFHFGVKMMVQFADILLPFIMALLLVTILEPVKQVTLEVLECTMILFLQKVPFCSCCLRMSRKGANSGMSPSHGGARREELNELLKKVLLLMSITITVMLAGRFFWIVARIVWLSGEAVTQDFQYYQSGVQKRGEQIHALLKRFHLEKRAQLDMDHMAQLALSLLQYVAEFLTQHVFYTLTQVSLTTIFVLFLLYSPVQRDFSPVMRGVFESMELYLKLKTFISLMMGITNGIALGCIGLELPAAWGLLTFCANFIPNVGGPVMSILPCVIALLDVRKSIYQVSAAFLAQFFLHFNIANFVEPIIFGTTEEIHGVVVLLGLSFFGYIWGVTGMFLSVPLLFAAHAWLDTIVRSPSTPFEPREDARFFMGVLEGRWLADSSTDQEEGEEVKLLTGAIEGEAAASMDTLPGMQVVAERQVSVGSGLGEVHAPPISTWEATGCLQALLAVRDPATDEIRTVGLAIRWVLLTSAYVLIFFGFYVFHWDLEDLIRDPELPDGVAVNATATDVTAVTPVPVLAPIELTTTAAHLLNVTSAAAAPMAALVTTTAAAAVKTVTAEVAAALGAERGRPRRRPAEGGDRDPEGPERTTRPPGGGGQDDRLPDAARPGGEAGSTGAAPAEAGRGRSKEEAITTSTPDPESFAGRL